ncbi:MAG TPA: class I SAM-dependent methyltransferase, partial [Candidatus Methanoperedens sp.]
DMDMVEAAMQNAGEKGLSDRIKIQQGDALALDLPDESVDAVVSITVLHHVPGFEKAIAEAARVLKKEGILFIVDFDFKASIFPRFEVLLGRPDSMFTWSEMGEALKKAGLKVLKVKSHSMGLFSCAAAKRNE